MTETTVPSPPPEERPARSRRRVRPALAVLLGILACLALVATTTVVWVHQVALNTDRFVALTSSVASDPAVDQAVSQRISQQVVDALDVQARLVSVLPDRAQILAGPITTTIQQRLQVRIAELLASPRFQAAWASATRFTHTQLLAILRNDSTALTIDNGVLTLNVMPLVGAALTSLQSDGIIPASVSLPDLTSSTTVDTARSALQSALGVSLPADFGTIPLIRADRLEAARTAVRVFDLLVIVAIVVTVLLFVGAVLLARRRRRAVILLGAGAVVALLVARGAVRGIENSIVSSISDGGGAAAVRGVFDAVLDDLFGLMVIVTVVGAVVAIVAWLIGRREQIAEVASSAGGAARRATASGVEAGRAKAAGAAAAAAGAGAEAPTARDWVLAHVSQLRLAGVIVAVAWLAIIAEGWEPVAVVGALLVIYLVGLGTLSEHSGGDATEQPEGA